MKARDNVIVCSICEAPFQIGQEFVLTGHAKVTDLASGKIGLVHYDGKPVCNITDAKATDWFHAECLK